MTRIVPIDETLNICEPCRDGTHLECSGNKETPCECLVCEGERIGDRILGDGGGNLRRGQ